jgi:hypothetical protein
MVAARLTVKMQQALVVGVGLAIGQKEQQQSLAQALLAGWWFATTVVVYPLGRSSPQQEPNHESN